MRHPASTRRWLASAGLLAVFALIATSAAHAQRRPAVWEGRMSCSDRGWGDDRTERFCNIAESTMAAPAGTLHVDGRMNGGIAVIGTDRRDVRIRARIEAHARTEERAEELARAVRIHATGDRVYAEGPETRNREWWSVEFELEVPARSDLDLTAHNGGLTVTDVTGTLRLETLNGGIHLESVGGDVTAETTNGGLTVDLDGDRWEGRGLDATTMNGGVNVLIPSSYSAHLETGTTNGGVDIDFPVTVQGRIGRRITTDLGRGGPTVRVMTTNGGVNIRRGR